MGSPNSIGKAEEFRIEAVNGDIEAVHLTEKKGVKNESGVSDVAVATGYACSGIP